jgi:ribosomal protein L11 methyltransferase
MYLWRKHATNDWVRRQSEVLNERCGGSLAIVDRPGKRTTLEVVVKTQAQASALQNEFGGTIEKIRAGWFQQFAAQSRSKPLRIGSRLWVAQERGPNTITIPAETAFGTGEHATTAMCLRMLERITRERSPGWSLLDIGTGTGILAIAGARLGAKRVLAIDNDPVARRIAERNARANGIRRIRFVVGDVLKHPITERFDIITANLFSEILIAALPVWSRCLASDGSLIMSGVLRSQEKALVSAIARNGWDTREIKRRGKWIAALAMQAGKRS